jgi:NADPH:quinone reductase-like Zn-dependent oxidoreductase
MKAIVHDRYGPPDVLRLEEVPTPVPGDGDVLVRVHAASVNAGDWHLMRADPFLVRLMFGGLLRPRHRILGADVAGRVEAVGRDVKGLREGDEVFGDLSACGFGAFAEYACVPEAALAPKPSNLTFEEAAAVPLAATAALQGLRDKGRIRAGQRVLVNGASGGVGTFAVEIAKAFGAPVTGVCGPGNLDMVRSIGADRVIDYTREDYTRGGERYDLILDAAAFRSVLDCRRALAPEGVYVMVGGSTARMFQTMFLSPLFPRMRFLASKASRADLLFLKGLAEAGRLKPVIDRRYALAHVSDAIRYVEQGHARGKVVITA